MAVQVPSITTGRVDVFLDDVIHVFPDTPGALARLPHVVPLAMELTSQVHAGTNEPIPGRPILSPEKLLQKKRQQKSNKCWGGPLTRAD
jgi:hypothetical protein